MSVPKLGVDKLSAVSAEDGAENAGALAVMAAAAQEIKAEDGETVTVPPSLIRQASAPAAAGASATAGPPVPSNVLGPLVRGRLHAELEEFYQRIKPDKIADAAAILDSDVVLMPPCDEQSCRIRINFLLIEKYGVGLRPGLRPLASIADVKATQRV